jgi:hypothetical protein
VRRPVQVTTFIAIEVEAASLPLVLCKKRLEAASTLLLRDVPTGTANNRSLNAKQTKPGQVAAVHRTAIDT